MLSNWAKVSAADVGQLVDVVRADVEHSGLFFLLEGVSNGRQKP